MITPLTVIVRASCRLFYCPPSFFHPSSPVLFSPLLSLLHIFCRDEHHQANRILATVSRAPDHMLLQTRARRIASTSDAKLAKFLCISVSIFRRLSPPSRYELDVSWCRLCCHLVGGEDADLLFIYSCLSALLSWSRWSKKSEGGNRMCFMRPVLQQPRMKLDCLSAFILFL